MKFDIDSLRTLAIAAQGAGEWVSVGLWVESDAHDEPDICSCEPSAMGQHRFEQSHRALQLARSEYIAAIQPTVLLGILAMIPLRRDKTQ